MVGPLGPGVPGLNIAQAGAEAGPSGNKAVGSPKFQAEAAKIDAMLADMEGRHGGDPNSQGDPQSLADIDKRDPRLQALQAKQDVATDESNAGFLQTMTDNPLSTLNSLVRAIALTMDHGVGGAAAGAVGLLNTSQLNKNAAANEAAALGVQMAEIREERGDRLMQIMVAHPELLTEEDGEGGFRSIMDPLVLGDYLGMGFGVNPAMFMRMKNNDAVMANFLPRLIESSENLDSGGRMVGFQIASDVAGLNLTGEQIEALAINESRTADQWRDTFGEYIVGQGMVFAQGMGFDPTEGLNQPTVRHFMAQQVVKAGDSDISPSDKLKNLTLETWNKLHTWQLANHAKFLELRDNPEKMFDEADMTGAEFNLLAAEYGTLTDGFTEAELTEVVADAYIKAMSLVSTLVAIDADIAKDFEDPKKVFAFVDASVRQMMDGLRAVKDETAVAFMHRRATEISEASGGVISNDDALTAAQMEWDEQVAAGLKDDE